MYLGMVAIRHASASSLGPYTLLRLVIASIGGIVFFREVPDLLSWLGIASILLSCLVALVPPAPRAQAEIAL
jgi:drug/metabolite transporter (DMT)-like permease